MKAATALRVALSLLALGFLARRVAADGAYVHEEKDDRGRVRTVEPQQHTAIGMHDERVALVPFYDASIAKDQPLVYVNVRYAFTNPDRETTLRVGFPDMRGKVDKESYGYARPKTPGCGERSESEGGIAVVECPGSIERFAADADGRALDVTVGPGTADYLRWFVFDVPFPAHATTRLRNRYLARLGFTRRETNRTPPILDYEAEYILHTGSSWSGSIGEGTVGLWDGSWRELRHFADLRPTKDDDVHAKLALTETPRAGRPRFHRSYGNGEQNEWETPRFEKTSVVNASSSEPGTDLPHLPAMALDQDATTAWTDAGPNGAVGEWLEVPTRLPQRVRALSITQPDTRVDAGSVVARVKRLRLDCFALDGNARVPLAVDRVTLDLEDRAGEQRLYLPRPLAECHSLRLTVEELFGAAGSHAAIAEIAFPGVPTGP